MFEKPSKLRTTLLGGLIIGAITGTPVISILNMCCCCGGVMLCGMMSLYLYRQEFKEDVQLLESSDALIVGIMTGLAGAFIGTILAVLINFILGPIDKQIMIKLLSWAESQGSLPPDTLIKADEMMQTFQKSIEEGIKLRDILGNLLFNLIIYPIFSMLGGLIGFGIFGKKKPVAPPMQ
jgi:hypothetical protein